MTTPRVPATDVLAGSLAESAALASKTKSILRRQIAKMSAELDRADTNPHRKSELLRQILEISAVLNQNVESLGRLLHKPIASAPADTSSGTVTTESVMQEIISGTGKHKRGGA
jgi:hypothetical protein